MHRRESKINHNATNAVTSPGLYIHNIDAEKLPTTYHQFRVAARGRRERCGATDVLPPSARGEISNASILRNNSVIVATGGWGVGLTLQIAQHSMESQQIQTTPLRNGYNTLRYFSSRHENSSRHPHRLSKATATPSPLPTPMHTPAPRVTYIPQEPSVSQRRQARPRAPAMSEACSPPQPPPWFPRQYILAVWCLIGGSLVLPSDKNIQGKTRSTRGTRQARRYNRQGFCPIPPWLRFRDNLFDPTYLAPPAAFVIRYGEGQTETEQGNGSDAGSAERKRQLGTSIVQQARLSRAYDVLQ